MPDAARPAPGAQKETCPAFVAWLGGEQMSNGCLNAALRSVHDRNRLLVPKYKLHVGPHRDYNTRPFRGNLPGIIFPKAYNPQVLPAGRTFNPHGRTFR